MCEICQKLQQRQQNDINFIVNFEQFLHIVLLFLLLL